MDKFFSVPFARDGNKTDVPNGTTLDGSVSFTQGYPIGYQQDPDIDPLTAKDIERNKFNGLLFSMTKALQELQAHAIPDFITSAMNDGTPWSYSKQDLVRWNNGVETLTYESLVNSNTSTPSDITKWKLFGRSQFETGFYQSYAGTTLPTGWIFSSGGTIGNASSNATNRANADTSDLFSLLWTGYSNAILPIFNSDGSPSTRGASAAADFAANKAISVPDWRGRFGFGRDDMGGTQANRITVGGCGISGVTLGAVGGSETVSLTGSQNGAHTHVTDGYTLANTGAGYQLDRFGAANETGTGSNFTLSSQSSGTGAPHNNVPPAICMNVLLKL